MGTYLKQFEIDNACGKANRGEGEFIDGVCYLIDGYRRCIRVECLGGETFDHAEIVPWIGY
jgi:hypothetical protein